MRSEAVIGTEHKGGPKEQEFAVRVPISQDHPSRPGR